MDIISCRDAFDAGKTRYFTGIPCKYGHVSQRMVSNGGCVHCLNDRRAKNREKNYANVKRWRKANPGCRAEEARRYRKAHPEKVAETKRAYRQRNLDEVRKTDRERQARIRKANPDRERERVLNWRSRRESTLAECAGRPRPSMCDLCRGDSGGIVFDHCHIGGHFRGWLCDRCNKVLGLVQDSPKLLKTMARYVETKSGKAKREKSEQATHGGFCWAGSQLPDRK